MNVAGATGCGRPRERAGPAVRWGLGALASDPGAPPTVLVTHHVEEIPPGFTHALLLRGGRVVASGPLEEALTTGSLSAAFELPVALERRNGRWLAFGR